MKPMLLTREGSELVLERRVAEYRARKTVGERQSAPYLTQYTLKDRAEIRAIWALIILASSGWLFAAWLAWGGR